MYIQEISTYYVIVFILEILVKETFKLELTLRIYIYVYYIYKWRVFNISDRAYII